MDEKLHLVKVLPVLLGPKNAEAATGFSYRWCRDTAARLGVPFVGAGRKRGIRADLFLAALEEVSSTSATALSSPIGDARVSDPAEEVRELLRRAGSR